MDNPYEFPTDRPSVINFSGGRSSAYMLYHILDHYNGELPERVWVCFANTGAELEETLVFVNECQTRWNVPVVWLEYRHVPDAAGGPDSRKHTWAEVNFETASRDYEPYEAVILAKAMLPNVATRFCTTELKVRPVYRWVKDNHGYGTKEFRNTLGIRYDEPRRWDKAIFEECQVLYPMVHAKVTERDVLAFWGRQPFDLGLDQDEGNCGLCFLKGRAKLVRLIRRRPELTDWWIRMEVQLPQNQKWKDRRLQKVEMANFSKRWTYVELLDEALNGPRQGVLPIDDEPSVSCFCGD